jgi:hypothetical protein
MCENIKRIQLADENLYIYTSVGPQIMYVLYLYGCLMYIGNMYTSKLMAELTGCSVHGLQQSSVVSTDIYK